MVQPNSQVIPTRELDGREGSDPQDKDQGPASDSIVGTQAQSACYACLPLSFCLRLGIGAVIALTCLAIVNQRLSTVESRITALQGEGKKSGRAESRMTGLTSRVQALEQEEGKKSDPVEISMTGVTSRGLALKQEEGNHSKSMVYNRMPIGKSIVYNHMPKAGGTFVRGILHALIPRSDLKLENEWVTVTVDDLQHLFTMGSVRNPCDYYVSLYNFGAQSTRGEFQRNVGRAWYKNNDPKQFRKWLRHVTGGSKLGVMSYRLAFSYIPGQHSKLAKGPVSGQLKKAAELENILKHWNSSSISCWIKTESLTGTLRNCLSRYSLERSKPVNWKLFDRLVASQYSNPSKHSKCSYFYDNATKAFVMERDQHIFRIFGYATCC